MQIDSLKTHQLQQLAIAVQHTVLHACMDSWTLATLVTQMGRSVGVGTRYTNPHVNCLPCKSILLSCSWSGPKNCNILLQKHSSN